MTKTATTIMIDGNDTGAPMQDVVSSDEETTDAEQEVQEAAAPEAAPEEAAA